MNHRFGTLAIATAGLAGLLLLAAPLNAQSPRPKGEQGGSEKTETRTDLKTFSFPFHASWISSKPSSTMRLAQMSLPGPNAQSAAAELAVFHFPGTGGSVDANIARWKSQFEKPSRMKDSEFATERKTTADTLPVTILEVHGKFAGGGMPGRPAPTPIADARLFAIIVETSQGPYFIKVTGPATTIDHHRQALEAIVAGVKRGAKEPEGKKKPTSDPKG